MRKLRRILLGTALSLITSGAGMIFSSTSSFAETAANTHATDTTSNLFPPWQHGQNNDAINRGFEFTVPEVDSMADFHGSLTNPALVLYVGGNDYFAMEPLVQAFEKKYPEYAGRIFYITIPPGMLVTAMKDGGTFTSGNLTFTAKADAYLAGLSKVQALVKQGTLTGPVVSYITNDLTIMVPKGNPGHVTGLQDLDKPGIRLVMPNPAYEGIARQIKKSLIKSGGQTLEKAVYETGVKNGTTILTQIHHRQTPLFLMQGRADAGVTWISEAIFQEQIGHPITYVPIPPKDNTTAIYAGALVKGAAHPQAAEAWLKFIQSPTALAIFEHYGFKPYKKQKA